MQIDYFYGRTTSVELPRHQFDAMDLDGVCRRLIFVADCNPLIGPHGGGVSLEVGTWVRDVGSWVRDVGSWVLISSPKSRLRRHENANQGIGSSEEINRSR